MSQDWRVYLGTTIYGIGTALDAEVVSLNVRAGQSYYLEPMNAGQATIVARYPDGYATPDTNVVIGGVVHLVLGDPLDTGYAFWSGTITNVAVEYGIPYVGSVGNADFVTITAETPLGALGRNNATTVAGEVELGQWDLFGGTDVANLYLTATRSRFTPTTNLVNLSAREWTQLELVQYIQTTYGYLCRETALPAVNSSYTRFIPPYALTANTVNFSDTANNSTNQVYDNLTVTAASEDYYTKAEITAEGLSITVNADSGSSPPAIYQGSTVSPTQAQVQDVADAISNTFNDTDFAISGISCLSEAQNSWNLFLGTEGWNMIGTRSDVTFRGSTREVVVIGYELTATPESSRISYRVAPISYYDWLVLDSSEFGVLDTNRLGY
jgi:hypothetical protein